MKKFLLLAVAVAAVSTTYGQFYTSLSGGYGFAAGKKVVGEEVSATGSKTELKDSYGDGLQAQIRAGYFFTEKIGAELALGYLHGKDITTNKTPAVEMIGHGRAYGMSLSGVYNFTQNIYARAGAVIKIGGKSIVKTSLNTQIPAQLINPGAPAGATVPLTADFTNDFHGKFTVGFIGAVGYKHMISENIAVFGEVEYLAINVPRDKSKLVEFNSTLNGTAINPATLSSILAVASPDLVPLMSEEYTWTDAPDAPYSSFGFNIGLTYYFK